jgi:Ca2+-binding RTX toxin-like protein
MSFSGTPGNDVLVVTSAVQWGTYGPGSVNGGGGTDELRFAYDVALTDAADFSKIVNFENLVLLGTGVNSVSLGQFAAAGFQHSGAPRITITGYGTDFTVNVDGAFWGANSAIAINAATGGVNKLNGGGGADTFNFDNANDLLAAGAYVDGNGGIDRLAFRSAGTITDAHFASVSDMEQIILQGVGTHSLSLGANASAAFNGAANRIVVNAVQAGTLNLDASALGGPDVVSVSGSGGNDNLLGSIRADILRGGTGHDVIDGNDGNDNLHGEGGNDSVAGGAGNDNMFGNDGSDTLAGGLGADTMDGGNGDDILIAGGNDVMTGGGGYDIFRFGADTGSARITDFVVGSGGGTITFDDVVAASDFRYGSEYGAVTSLGGFAWTNLGILNVATNYQASTTGGSLDATSGDFTGFSGPALGFIGTMAPIGAYVAPVTLPGGSITGIEMTNGAPVDFSIRSASFSSSGASTTISVEAWDDGIVVGTWTGVVNAGSPVDVDFLASGTGRFFSVDKVVFGGTGTFGLDDVEVAGGEVIALTDGVTVDAITDVLGGALIDLSNGGFITVSGTTAAAVGGNIWVG